ncbi:hypothetical protein [Caproicibacterium amylolyticum]|uniref:Uncharacterized protein n=1 Tax=Caproicibacterium amylolyticum TaxID=2766537 RepID=A0A7G9WJU8_9FIRM|nr:hypothetical protein [Caproicibacterium amylolyticum]QNO18960.1 hypothetical protein H6X83_04865 [Caproicibacterium amylolyticum]
MANELSINQASSTLQITSPAGASVAVRSAKEVEAMVLMAKRFPRDEVTAESKIIKACKRERLAQTATYEYPRGGTKVTGPSIRLAEVLAQNWGNIDFGWTELARDKNVDGTETSHCEAWAWDIESNTRRSIRFDVPLVRDTKRGSYALTEERDKYEMCANQAARRMRACLLNVLPGDIIEEALEECNHTLAKSEIPLETRRDNAIKSFAKIGVTQQMLEKYLGCKSSAWSPNDMYRLTKVLNSIHDGMTTPGEHFSELSAKPIAGEQQGEILKKYGAEKVEKALKLGGYGTLNDITTDTLEPFTAILDSQEE